MYRQKYDSRILALILCFAGAGLASSCQGPEAGPPAGAGPVGSTAPQLTDPPNLGAPSPSTSPPTTGNPSEAALVLKQTNDYRASNGLPALLWNQRLAAAVQAYAEAMASQGFFSHTGPDGSDPGSRIAAQGYSAMTWGENIAYGYASADAAMQGWINSSGHRANILGSFYQEIGIGVVAAAGSGTIYWVQDIGAP